MAIVMIVCAIELDYMPMAEVLENGNFALDSSAVKLGLVHKEAFGGAGLTSPFR